MVFSASSKINYKNMITKVSSGTVHKLSVDLKEMLLNNPRALATWEATTPLARNEWICLVTSSKQDQTRARRLDRARDQLSKGQRRPCCWVGCIHRKDKEMSASQKWALDLDKRSK